jgi:hypothetical protein
MGGYGMNREDLGCLALMFLAIAIWLAAMAVRAA